MSQLKIFVSKRKMFGSKIFNFSGRICFSLLPDPLSTTRAATSSSAIFEDFYFWCVVVGLSWHEWVLFSRCRTWHAPPTFLIRKLGQPISAALFLFASQSRTRWRRQRDKEKSHQITLSPWIRPKRPNYTFYSTHPKITRSYADKNLEKPRLKMVPSISLHNYALLNYA